MSQPERFKEEISWLKAVGTALLAAAISVGAWLVQNYETASHSVLLGAICVLFGLISMIAGATFRLYRCLKILEAL
jgi:hypothetical protein